VKILIVGGGGREYSIGLSLCDNNEIYFAPGNGATENLGTNISIKDYEELATFAKNESIQLTIVGPEQPLADGIVDIFKSHNLTIFGPSKKAARLEGSKAFMKNFLKKYSIKTASFTETKNKQEAFDFIDNMQNNKIVVKADGLCGGKGVIIANSKDEAKKSVEDMLSGTSFGSAGSTVIVEEFLDGYELSVFAICDGDNFILLPAAQDHKRLEDGDLGPNTGGMGAYSPTSLVDDNIYKEIEENICKPTMLGMKKEGSSFSGILFIGLMIVNKSVYVLEYNVRFGDPECEVLLPLLSSNPLDIFYNSATNNLDKIDVKFNNKYAVGVVMASGNYPYKSSTPSEIIVDKIVHQDLEKGSHISYAGVTKNDGKLFATGGRVLVCVGIGDSIKKARDNAYLLCGQVHFAGKKLRYDIAYQDLNR
jgi:phosphoribosylamine--glycine ligase